MPMGVMDEHDRQLAASAAAASKEAIEQAFAAGLSVTVLQDGWIVRIAPDGTVTKLEELKE